jgi:hypothetical protein
MISRAAKPSHVLFESPQALSEQSNRERNEIIDAPIATRIAAHAIPQFVARSHGITRGTTPEMDALAAGQIIAAS